MNHDDTRGTTTPGARRVAHCARSVGARRVALVHSSRQTRFYYNGEGNAATIFGHFSESVTRYEENVIEGAQLGGRYWEGDAPAELCMGGSVQGFRLGRSLALPGGE